MDGEVPSTFVGRSDTGGTPADSPTPLAAKGTTPSWIG